MSFLLIASLSICNNNKFVTKYFLRYKNIFWSNAHTSYFIILLQKYVARITYLDILRDSLRLALLELLHLLRGQHPQPVLPPVQHQRLVEEDRVKVRGAEDLLGGGESRAAT